MMTMEETMKNGQGQAGQSINYKNHPVRVNEGEKTSDENQVRYIVVSQNPNPLGYTPYAMCPTFAYPQENAKI